MDPNLPPELAAKVAKAREYQRIALAVHEAIEADGIQIQDLSVAFSGGLAVLSGVANTQADSERAAKIASNHQAVRQVNNQITVRELRV